MIEENVQKLIPLSFIKLDGITYVKLDDIVLWIRTVASCQPTGDIQVVLNEMALRVWESPHNKT